MKELRDKLRAKLSEARAIVEKAKTEKRANTAEELTQYDALMVEVKTIKDQITVHERSEQLQAELDAMAPETQRTASTTDAETRDNDDNDTGSENGGGEQRNRETRTQIRLVGGYTYERGDSLGAIVSARHRFGMDRPAALRWAERQYGSGSPQARAMQQSVFTAGGATIAQNFVASELIELLRARAAVRRAGARELPLVNGSATLPKITGGASAGWGDEGENIVPSELTTSDITLTEKKLTCLVPVSNDLLKNSNIQVDRLIRDDMVRAAANAEDVAFLKGPGTSKQPKGIYYWVGDPGRTNSAGSTLANVRTDIRVSKNYLGNNNAPLVRRAWFMHSRAINYMGWDLVDGNSNFAFPQLQQGDGANLGGATVREDNNISITLGAGTDSEIYYVEMSECFIGDNGELELELFANAAYADAAGTIRSGISRDESVVRLIRKTDFAMRHSVSAHVLEAVGYGA